MLAPGRIKELQDSAKKLSDWKANDAVDDSLALRLLADLIRLWPDSASHWPSATIVDALRAEPELPRAGEVELNQRRLARMLRPFEVLPRDVRTDSGTRKGYLFEEVKAAPLRYGGVESATSATDRMNTGEI